jgi:hypothetical protein
MALQSFNGVTGGTSGITVAGISVVTSSSAGQEYGTTSKAKDADGEVKALFFSKGQYVSQVSGYTGSIGAPALGGGIAGVDGSQKIMSSSLQASNQDFAKVTVTGKGI